MTSTVLVVDDEIVVADVIAETLRDEGYTVVTASNGAKALALLELLREFKELSRHRSVPSILMSSVPENKSRKYEAGYSAFMKKPFKLDTLIQLVRRVLAGSLD